MGIIVGIFNIFLLFVLLVILLRRRKNQKNLVRFTYWDKNGKELYYNITAEHINHEFKQSLYYLIGGLCRTIKKSTNCDIYFKHKRVGSQGHNIEPDSIGGIILINGFKTREEEERSLKNNV